MTYKNKIIWVTGASSGIGRALSLKLDQMGARLIVSGRNLEALNKLISECKQSELHRVVCFDLADTDNCEQTVETAWAFNDGIDILVNNGGVSQRSLAIDTSLAVDRRVMEIDYFGTIALTKALVAKFQQRQAGKLINIASIAGKVGSPMRSAYSGAKHALIGFMDCLRAEVAHLGIEVVNVCPGFVSTDISRNALTGDMSKYQKLDEEIAHGMSAELFVDILLKKLQSSKREIIIARGLPKFGYQVRRFLPNIFHWLLPKIYNRKS